MADDEKKVDEEWKAQVERDKELLAKETVGAKPKEQAPPKEQERPPLPEASFPLLISEYATRAYLALGSIPNPAAPKAGQDLDQARYCIGMLEVIQERTKGNVTDEESQALEDLLFQVRMQYVNATKEAKGEPA